MEGWDSFFVAEAGAAAALAGLVFVGVSVNLQRIMAYPTLPGRALEAIVVLIEVLVVSTFMLVPRQPVQVLGLEILVSGLVLWITVLVVSIPRIRLEGRQYLRPAIVQLVFSQAATLSYVVAGVWLLLSGVDGVYWLVPAVLLSYVTALADAWVLLIEINR